jgi:hypothetical protein
MAIINPTLEDPTLQVMALQIWVDRHLLLLFGMQERTRVTLMDKVTQDPLGPAPKMLSKMADRLGRADRLVRRVAHAMDSLRVKEPIKMARLMLIKM